MTIKPKLNKLKGCNSPTINSKYGSMMISVCLCCLFNFREEQRDFDQIKTDFSFASVNKNICLLHSRLQLPLSSFEVLIWESDKTTLHIRPSLQLSTSYLHFATYVLEFLFTNPKRLNNYYEEGTATVGH
jgi:hypothetical protein